MVWFHLAMSTKGTNQSLDMRPKYNIKIIPIFLIKNFR